MPTLRLDLPYYISPDEREGRLTPAHVSVSLIRYAVEKMIFHRYKDDVPLDLQCLWGRLWARLEPRNPVTGLLQDPPSSLDLTDEDFAWLASMVQAATYPTKVARNLVILLDELACERWQAAEPID